MKTKLYCFVDETGQDTKGSMFLVAIVLHSNTNLLILEKILDNVENETGKKKLKWKKTNNEVKQKYLDYLINIKELKNTIYYSKYINTKEYSRLTSLTIAKAILSKGIDNYEVTIMIDGLNDREREVVAKDLRGLKIKYRKIRGIKDEQNVFIRLADAMAGFLRDELEKQSYTSKFIKQLTNKNIVTEA